MLGVRGMAIGAALTFGAVLWWANRGTEPGAEGTARLHETPASHARAFSADAWSAPAVKDDPAAAPLLDEATADESQSASYASFERYVADKYRYLLDSRGLESNSAIRLALVERERLQVELNTARQGGEAADVLAAMQSQLDALDVRVARTLPAADITAFTLLKDSHIEQFQLDDFAQGVANVAPLAEHQRRAVMLSKLATRARFRDVLEQSGFMTGQLTVAQRQAVLGQLSRALQESRDSFLQEARQHLGDAEQYQLLANYENGEYSAELETLRRIAAGG